MRDKPIRILSTRPIEEALVEKAADYSIIIDQETFIEIKKQVSEEAYNYISSLATQPSTVAFTSMNAVEVLLDTLPNKAAMPDWKIYCMGGATFTLVKKYWAYESIVATAKNATELAEIIINNEVKSLTFFCGNKRREELPVLLIQNKVAVNEVIIYETIETSKPVKVEYDAILFFSPSAVHSFFISNTLNTATTVFAIGNTSAKAIKQFCDNTIIISDFPSKDQLVQKAINYFTNKME